MWMDSNQSPSQTLFCNRLQENGKFAVVWYHYFDLKFVSQVFTLLGKDVNEKSCHIFPVSHTSAESGITL